MSVDGLISGLDTTSLISQLVQAEAAPQIQLKTKLGTVNAGAAAYRTVNTRFDAIRTAAQALTTSGLAAARTAKGDNAAVTASATTAAANGSRISFAVETLASTASYLSGTAWASTGTDVRTPEDGGVSPWPLVLTRDGVTREITPPDPATLQQTVDYINANDFGVRATTVNTGTNGYRLQLTSTTPGAAGYFDVGSTSGEPFTVLSPATDATIDLNGVKATSSSNTFTDLLTGVSVTVTKADPTALVTVTVGEDAEGTAAKVKTLVDAVNSALDGIKTFSNSKGGSTAVLKGDTELRALGNKLLEAVAHAVGIDLPSDAPDAGVVNHSPALVGLELSKDGKITFDSSAFAATLAKDPALAEKLVSGAGGVAQRLADVAKRASDSATGTLTALATSRDRLAGDLKTRIAAWDVRLAKRKETLTRQFTAMETALSSLKNQSTWLAGQLNSLPSSS
jgi:flagellar hook-associated protein 2